MYDKIDPQLIRALREAAMFILSTFLDEIDYERNPRLRIIAQHIEIFADRHRPLKTCPEVLRTEVQEFCDVQNQKANDSVVRAYRAGLLP